MNRAYSTITLKSIDEEGRILEGIASTPTPDRMDDILEVDGMVFRTPFPFLYHHDSKRPIGQVVSAKKTADGLMIRAQLAKDEVAPWIPEARKLIGAGLIRGFSIGFRPTKEPEYIKATGGLRYTHTEIFEVSAVTIPANAEATILTVKSADLEALAALGHKRDGVVRLANLPGVSGRTLTPKGIPNMTLQEQIASFEAKRAASVGRMETIMTKASEEGRTLEVTETQEYDGLETEVKAVDDHIARLKKHEVAMVAKATPVTAKDAKDPDTSAAVRRSDPITVKSNAPKGIGVARMAIAMVRAGGNPYQAIEIAKQLWGDQAPEVASHIKSVVEAGDTTTSGWASQLVPAAQSMDNEFLEMLRDSIVIGRIPGLKKVPFNISVPLQSGAGTYGWVGEGAPKPVTKPTFGSATLRFEKAAGIIVITEELARFSRPDAEMLVRDEMIKGLTAFFDTTFVGSAAAVTNVSPAGILNGKSPTVAGGTTAARFRYDLNVIIQTMITAKLDPSKWVLLMSPGMSMSLSSMINSLANPEFPTISATGGSYLGIPIVVSQALGTNIILIQPDQILIAEDPGVRIDVSREASVEMDTEPVGGETSPVTQISTYKSFFQNNLIGIRCEQFRTWKVARAAAVEYISGAAYAPPTS